jgi:hypothetical protein
MGFLLQCGVDSSSQLSTVSSLCQAVRNVLCSFLHILEIMSPAPPAYQEQDADQGRFSSLWLLCGVAGIVHASALTPAQHSDARAQKTLNKETVAITVWLQWQEKKKELGIRGGERGRGEGHGKGSEKARRSLRGGDERLHSRLYVITSSKNEMKFIWTNVIGVLCLKRIGDSLSSAIFIQTTKWNRQNKK